MGEVRTIHLNRAIVADEQWAPGIRANRARIERTKPVARTTAVERETDAGGVLRELMAGDQAGDLDAFDELYRRTQVLVHRYDLAYAADRSQASDLVQDTYPQLHRSRRLYDRHMAWRKRSIASPNAIVIPWCSTISSARGFARSEGLSAPPGALAFAPLRGMAAPRRVLGAA